MSWDDSKLAAWGDRIRDLGDVPTEATEAAAVALRDVIDDQFRDGVDPYGNPWVPLAPSTLARGRTDPPLLDTGAMLGSLVVEAVTSTRIEVEMDHPAMCHQTGWVGPQGTGPARPIVPIATDGDAPRWVEAIRGAVDATVVTALGTP